MATITAAAVGIGFVALAPDIPSAQVGRGLALFAGGLVAALAAVASTLTGPRAPAPTR